MTLDERLLSNTAWLLIVATRIKYHLFVLFQSGIIEFHNAYLVIIKCFMKSTFVLLFNSDKGYYAFQF